MMLAGPKHRAAAASVGRQRARACAVCSGSSGSGGGGALLVATAQKRQPRVQVSPSSMMVAVPMPAQSSTLMTAWCGDVCTVSQASQPCSHAGRAPSANCTPSSPSLPPFQHSPMLGHCASWHTVASFSSRSWPCGVNRQATRHTTSSAHASAALVTAAHRAAHSAAWLDCFAPRAAHLQVIVSLPLRRLLPQPGRLVGQRQRRADGRSGGASGASCRSRRRVWQRRIHLPGQPHKLGERVSMRLLRWGWAAGLGDGGRACRCQSPARAGLVRWRCMGALPSAAAAAVASHDPLGAAAAVSSDVVC